MSQASAELKFTLWLFLFTCLFVDNYKAVHGAVTSKLATI